MRVQAVAAAVGSLALAGCATGDPFEGSRSVFNNPYATPVVDKGPVGPECSERVVRQDGCFLDSLIYPGRGRYALDRDGNTIRLTRSERRFLRQRNDAIQARIDILNSLENGTPIPPNSPALDNIPPPPVPKVGDTIPVEPTASR